MPRGMRSRTASSSIGDTSSRSSQPQSAPYRQPYEPYEPFGGTGPIRIPGGTGPGPIPRGTGTGPITGMFPPMPPHRGWYLKSVRARVF